MQRDLSAIAELLVSFWGLRLKSHRNSAPGTRWTAIPHTLILALVTKFFKHADWRI